jgi:hypothetical protein
MRKSETLTIVYSYDDEEGPSLDEVRRVAALLGCDLSKFVTQAICSWTEERHDVLQREESNPAPGGDDPLGIGEKLQKWAGLWRTRRDPAGLRPQ